MSPTSPWLLVLCHEFPPLGGGCGRNLHDLCRELARRGVRLEVWTLSAARPAASEFPVRGFKTGRKAVFETNFVRLLRYAGQVRKAAREVFNPPAAVFSAMGFPAGWAGARLGRLWEAPHFVWYHGSDVHFGQADGPGIMGRGYLRWLFRHARGSFFVSKNLQTLAAKAGAPPWPRILPSTPEAMRRTGATRGEAPGYFLWAGRLEPVKDPLLFIRALALAANRAEGGVPFRMVGEGRLNTAVKRALSALGHAGLEPPIPSERMPEVLGGAWAVVLTSRVEGFSTLLLEAACLGVPAVACDAPGVGEFIRDGVNGVLVRSRDPEALAAALTRLWKDPALRARLGEQARRDAEAFTPARNADIVLGAFRESGIDFIPQAESA